MFFSYCDPPHSHLTAMALWSHLLISRHTWKALCHQHNDKKCISSDSLQLKSGPMATTTNTAELVLASAQSGASSSAAPSSPISSESSSSSSTTSGLETNRTPSRLGRNLSSESSSNLPTSTSSLVPTACSPPTSRPPGAPHNHITLFSPTTSLTSGNRVSQLANHITSTCHRARSQHDHLAPPLQQLLQAGRTRSCSLNGPYPALDMSRNLSNVHTKLLNSVLEVISKLSLLETSLRHVKSIRTVTLATIEGEIEDVKVLIRKPRRFEERIKRYLRLEAERGGGGVWEVIAMVRDRFSPEMRDFICGMNLLAVKVQFMGLQLGIGLGSARVPGATSFEN